MVTTVGPERTRWQGEDWHHPIDNPFAQEAIAARGYTDWDLAPEPEPEIVPAERPYPVGLTAAQVATRNAAVQDAMGDEPFDAARLDAEQDHEYAERLQQRAEPSEARRRTEAAFAYADAMVAAPEASSRGYVVRDGDWRERIGLPRKRKTMPSSRTPEGRRKAHIRDKAERLGISFAEADRMTQHRQPKRKPAA